MLMVNCYHLMLFTKLSRYGIHGWNMGHQKHVITDQKVVGLTQHVLRTGFSIYFFQDLRRLVENCYVIAKCNGELNPGQVYLF